MASTITTQEKPVTAGTTQTAGQSQTRIAMEKLFGQLGKKAKLPRLQPPERIRANIRGAEGVTYTVIDRHGEANILNHIEMTELHAVAEEIRKAANATSEQRAVVQTN